MARFPPPHWRPHWVFNKQLQPVALCFLTRLHTHTHLSQPASLWAALAMHPFPGGDFRAGEALRGAQGGGRCPPPPLFEPRCRSDRRTEAGITQRPPVAAQHKWLHSTSGYSALFPLVPKSTPPYREPCAAGGCSDSPQHPQGLRLASVHRANNSPQ